MLDEFELCWSGLGLDLVSVLVLYGSQHTLVLVSDYVVLNTTLIFLRLFKYFLSTDILNIVQCHTFF